MSSHRLLVAVSRQVSVQTERTPFFAVQQRTNPHVTQSSTLSRWFASIVVRPTKPVTKEERIALRAARKEHAAQVIQQAKGVEGEASSASTSTSGRSFLNSKYLWYASVGVPSALLVWGVSDTNSPPAKFSKLIGLTGLIERFTREIAKPSHDKLLPDWSQVGLDWCLPNVSFCVGLSIGCPFIVFLDAQCPT
jgi:hypothetical protein